MSGVFVVELALPEYGKDSEDIPPDLLQHNVLIYPLGSRGIAIHSIHTQEKDAEAMLDTAWVAFLLRYLPDLHTILIHSYDSERVARFLECPPLERDRPFPLSDYLLPDKPLRERHWEDVPKQTRRRVLQAMEWGPRVEEYPLRGVDADPPEKIWEVYEAALEGVDHYYAPSGGDYIRARHRSRKSAEEALETAWDEFLSMWGPDNFTLMSEEIELLRADYDWAKRVLPESVDDAPGYIHIPNDLDITEEEWRLLYNFIEVGPFLREVYLLD